jgi:adenylylsulfate kinase
MEFQKATNIIKHPSAVSRIDRANLLGHRSFTLWFTGLPASGKSTIAVATEKVFHKKGCLTYVLDGDNVRYGLNKNLGFSPADREENIRRLAEVAKLFRDAGVINLTAFISPYRKDRAFARSLSQGNDFIEIFLDCPLEICEQRDPKGLFKKAREGLIKEYTGISAPYEKPEEPEIHILTNLMTVDECVDKIFDYILGKGLI